MRWIKNLCELSSKKKHGIALSLCGGIVVLAMVGSWHWSSGQTEANASGVYTVEVSQEEENQNEVQLQLGSTSEKKVSSAKVVGQNSSSEKNKVEENVSSEPAKLVSALLEDYGTEQKESDVKVSYQYPVVVGGEIEDNYDQKQTAQSQIKKKVFKTESDGAAVSGGAVESVEEDLAETPAAIEGEKQQETVQAASGTAVQSIVVEDLVETPAAIEQQEEQTVTESAIQAQASYPKLTLADEDTHLLSDENNRIFCTNKNQLKIKMEQGDYPLEKVACAYGDKMVYVTESMEETSIALPQEFYGDVLLYGKDVNGNISNVVSESYLVDETAPKISFSQHDTCTAPYTMTVGMSDAGHITSGIAEVECTVNGEQYKITDLEEKESVQLTEGIAVSSRMGFSLTLDKVGTYEVSVKVTDNAGNETTEDTEVVVGEPELVAVYMPDTFTIHIDPQKLCGRESLFSDDIVLQNVSNVDVKVTVEEVKVSINSETSEQGVQKDADLYLVAPDSGKKIKLEKGNNKDVYSYRLPIGEQSDLASLRFVGSLSEGSDSMWKDSDVSINLKLRFDKWGTSDEEK
jgi:hypothetical protein